LEEQMAEMIIKNNELSQIVKLYQFNLQRISKISPNIKIFRQTNGYGAQ